MDRRGLTGGLWAFESRSWGRPNAVKGTSLGGFLQPLGQGRALGRGVKPARHVNCKVNDSISKPVSASDWLTIPFSESTTSRSWMAPDSRQVRLAVGIACVVAVEPATGFVEAFDHSSWTESAFEILNKRSMADVAGPGC